MQAESASLVDETVRSSCGQDAEMRSIHCEKETSKPPLAANRNKQQHTGLAVATTQAESAPEGEPANVDDGVAAASGNRRFGCYLKVFFGILLIGLITYCIVDSATAMNVKTGLASFLRWLQDHPAQGVFLFVVVYLVATLLLIPGSLLTLGAGFVFSRAVGLCCGVLLGTTAVVIGAFLGAMAAFVVGRYLFRDQVIKLTKRYAIFEALDAALEENGLKILVLIRLSPVIPYNVINYICGVSSVSFRDYFLSFFAIIPGCLLFVFLGGSAGSLTGSARAGEDNTVTIVVVVVGAVFGVLAICVTGRYARKELNRVVAAKQQQQQQASEDALAATEGSGESSFASQQDIEEMTSGFQVDNFALNSRLGPECECSSSSREPTAALQRPLAVRGSEQGPEPAPAPEESVETLTSGSDGIYLEHFIKPNSESQTWRTTNDIAAKSTTIVHDGHNCHCALIEPVAAIEQAVSVQVPLTEESSETLNSGDDVIFQEDFSQKPNSDLQTQEVSCS